MRICIIPKAVPVVTPEAPPWTRAAQDSTALQHLQLSVPQIGPAAGALPAKSTVREVPGNKEGWAGHSTVHL